MSVTFVYFTLSAIYFMSFKIPKLKERTVIRSFMKATFFVFLFCPLPHMDKVCHI